MSDSSDFCIISEIEGRLRAVHGEVVSRNFRLDFCKHAGRNNMINVSPREQIRLLNGYWRLRLSTIPNTTEVKSWIEDNPDPMEYLHIFRTHWMDRVVLTGVYGGVRG